jgi:non-heme chloroperoxidase
MSTVTVGQENTTPIELYHEERLASCVFIESLAPSFVKSTDNPKGVDEATVGATA